MIILIYFTCISFEGETRNIATNADIAVLYQFVPKKMEKIFSKYKRNMSLAHLSSEFRLQKLIPKNLKKQNQKEKHPAVFLPNLVMSPMVLQCTKQMTLDV